MQGETDGDLAPNEPAKVPTADSTNTTNVTNSDKPDNKLSNKPADLAEIVAVWPELPEHIKAAIKALIQTHITEKK